MLIHSTVWEVKKTFILASILYGDNNYDNEPNYDTMSEFSELSEDNGVTNGDSDSSSDDEDDESEKYLDLSKIHLRQDSSDTDPQEYEDYVDFKFYTEHIERKPEPAQTSSSSNLRPHLARNDFGSSSVASFEKQIKSSLQRRPHLYVKPKQCTDEPSPVNCPKVIVEEPSIFITSFEDDFESSLEFIEKGPRGTLKKGDALNVINLTDIQGETANEARFFSVFCTLKA